VKKYARAAVALLFLSATAGGQATPPAQPTADEIANDLNLSVLSVRPRVSELKRTGKIKQTGARRKNESGMTATVWRTASGALR